MSLLCVVQDMWGSEVSECHFSVCYKMCCVVRGQSVV